MEARPLPHALPGAPLSHPSHTRPPRISRSPPPPSPQIWVTAICLGHLLGIAFLLYSVERVTGVFSRLARKAGLIKAGEAEDDGDFLPSSAVAGAKAIDGAFVDGGDEDTMVVRAPRWVRGCACKVRGCVGRWVGRGEGRDGSARRDGG